MAKKSKGTPIFYALCLSDGDHPESLQVRKVYQVIDDPRAVARGCLRIIDETGEDYLYPTSIFLLLELPATVEEYFAAA